MSEQIEEIFAYYGKQRDKSSQEMVIALLRELQEAEGCITPELKVRVIETTEITDKFLNCLIKMYPSIKEAKQAHEIIACTGERCGKERWNDDPSKSQTRAGNQKRRDFI